MITESKKGKIKKEALVMIWRKRIQIIMSGSIRIFLF
jgi:hypothetical protein